jgi:predicted AlkP superfamily phosphohydrolase/phosphomutase
VLDSSRDRVIIIGLDGGTFRFLQPLMADGHMPNLKRLVEEGAWGELASTIPPVTAPAWATFATGKNPGKHGVFDFQVYAPGQKQRSFMSSHDVRGDKFWNLLGQEGLRTGLINLPLTYPPEPIQGFVVSGMLTPSLESQFTFPAELQVEVLRVAPEYVTDVNLLTSEWHYYDLASLRSLVAELSASLQQRHLLVQYLASQQTWDALVVVITELDRAQHLLYKLLEDAGITGPWRELRQQAIALYRQADETIGSLRQMMDDRTTLLVVSDHGFGPLDRRFNLNVWLAQNGWLKFGSGKSLLRSSIKRVAKGSGLDKLIPETWRRRARDDFSAYNCIDWSATLAYSGTPLEQGVRINLQGREPLGIVEPGTEHETLRAEIAQQLLQIRDPKRGTQIIDRVYPCEELYDGPAMQQAPDLVFSLNDYRCILSEGLPDQPLFDEFPFPWAGYHNPQGIFVAAGHRVEPIGYLANAHIADIAPTVLHLLGVPIPRDVDGRVLSELLSPSWMAANPVSYREAADERSIEFTKDAYADEDVSLIEDRLRRLGYLG